MTLSSNDRVRAYRLRQRELSLPDSSRANKKEHKREYRRNRPDKSFVGCDGEGCGLDEIGRQRYMLFRMGARELFTGNHLDTRELLDFICESNPQSIFVGFAFGYDVTMILRDLSEAQQRRLFEPKIFDNGHSRYVWYKDFDIDYLPKQYFRVRRVKVVRSEGAEKRIPIVGSARTIYETFGFFQKTFVASIQSFEVGTVEQRESVARNKLRRSQFETIGQEERDYCELECDLLAQMMERLRDHCKAAGIVPRTWNGAGKLAAALHDLHETPKSKTVNSLVPKEVLDLANMAYYGGRFEITRVGAIKEKVYEYDICSAYPDAMRQLPCLSHGRWTSEPTQTLSRHNGLYIAHCAFKGQLEASGTCQLGGLPIRSREGHLFWPVRGAGIYWSPEIASARRMGVKISLKHGWCYNRECDCKPFDWVENLYEYRKSIGSQGPGYPIKLGINSLYGKLAQRVGNGVYNNMIWAGLITALTRAKLNDAIRLAPGRIVMIATDAVYSLDSLPLDIGDKLGQWEAKELDGLFIVQPGLYWSPNKRKKKSRGLSGNFFERPGLTEGFEAAWFDYQAKSNSGIAQGFPECKVDVPGFVGLKIALARNKPGTAGKWAIEQRTISFDHRNKRQSHIWCDEHICTSIKSGSPGLVSLPHKDFLASGGQEPWEMARLVLEEQPDYVDVGPPFEG